MPFSVKSDRADALLAELRDLTGEGITEAVIRSLELRLREVHHRSRPDPEEILRIAERFRTQFSINPWKSGERELSITHGSELYGDDGLPK